MFVGTGTPRKPAERRRARELRRDGKSLKRIARELEVSPSSVLHWTRDVELTADQRQRILRRGPQSDEVIARRVAATKARRQARRVQWQQEGRARARSGDLLHQAGCMLYWAEGAKCRNSVLFCNSDVHMVGFFRRFMTECFEVGSDRFRLSLYVYLGNALTLAEIERHWLSALELPSSCLRKHQLNPLPTSSSGTRPDKLPYGVATLKVHSTRIVQHIYGAIQEYAGFEEPRWLDGPPRRPSSGRRAAPG